MFVLSFVAEAGSSNKFRGTCKSCTPPVTGEYEYYYDSDGTKMTRFIGDDGKTDMKYQGHRTSLVGEGEENGDEFSDFNFHLMENSISVSTIYASSAIAFDNSGTPLDTVGVVPDNVERVLSFRIPFNIISTIKIINDYEILFTIDLNNCCNETIILNTPSPYTSIADSYQVVLTPATLTFSTELSDVYIKILELNSGIMLTDYIDATSGLATINIANLANGCNYALIISSLIYGEMMHTDTYNFCIGSN